MRVIQIGNFRPPHSTENHLLAAMRTWGWEVTPLQEDDLATFPRLAHNSMESLWTELAKPDFVLWTRTGWDWSRLHDGHSYPGGRVQANADQHGFLRSARWLGVPVVGYHLDIWHGLPRVREVDNEPFFHVPLLITADGGHEDEWTVNGINHVWFPPAVLASECEPGMYRDEYRSKIAFVGSWQGGYHPESAHRHELVAWLKKNFRRDCRFWPAEGQPAVRGSNLRDLYASVDVVVGDSCFVGTGLANYWSDRIPETVGRGGFLLHPYVPGLEKHFTMMDFGTSGPDSQRLAHEVGKWEHFGTWTAGKWDQLGTAIEWALTHPEERGCIRNAGRRHVLEHHTYERRMQQLAELLKERDMIR